ncbi:YheC/YheD family protein [Paenibacillus sp. CC-CFT747]|nr:YheC/YheD family protein [Paenibacillus sp. CC-CFT747]
MSRTSISSKMIKTRLLLPNPRLAKHVPETRILTRHRLRLMLEKYRMVYVKPDSGSRGIGVVRVQKGRQSYRYKSGERTQSFRSFGDMYRSLRRRTGGRLYLAQRGIRLLKYRGRPFDFRVMIQRDPNRVWQNTGTVGRLAHPRKAVTNGSQGARSIPRKPC